MPLSAKDLLKDDYLRVLLMGVPKIGKTAMCIGTSPGFEEKKVHVLLCESDDALKYAYRKFGDVFTFDRISGWNTMTKALLEAKNAAKEGKIKTLIVDPLSDYATRLEEEMLQMTDKGNGPDGRRAYPEYNRRLRHNIESLLRMPCNVIIISHFVDTGGGEVTPDDGGDPTPRTGEGIVPLLAGKARALVAAKIPNVVFMDYRKGDRVLVTGPLGVWGPGCRDLDGTQIIPADIHSTQHKVVGIKALIEAMKNVDAPKKKVAPAPAPAVKPAAKPAPRAVAPLRSTTPTTQTRPATRPAPQPTRR